MDTTSKALNVNKRPKDDTSDDDQEVHFPTHDTSDTLQLPLHAQAPNSSSAVSRRNMLMQLGIDHSDSAFCRLFPQNSDQWSCSFCTFLNAPRSSQCAMCGKKPPSSGSTEWTCTRCTLINAYEDSNCTMCDAPKSSKV